MTPEFIAEFMVSLANLNDTSEILEPSSGQGIFLDVLSKKGHKNITAYEVDPAITSGHSFVINESFVSIKSSQSFDLIIGNPPYIRWKNLEQELKDELSQDVLWNTYCNSLCDYSSIFIIKAIEMLKSGGQLIFITPEYWLNTTHSMRLRNYMLDHGFFEKIYHFNETPIFGKVTVSTVIFKYVKSSNDIKNKIKVAKYYQHKKLDSTILDNLKNLIKQESTEYLEIKHFEKNTNWVLAHNEMMAEIELFEEMCRKDVFSDLLLNEYHTIKDVCDIGNGMVSGLDKAFQVDRNSLTKSERKYLLKVIKAKDINPFSYNQITDYLMINEDISNEDDFKTKFPNFYNHLRAYKKGLNNRYQYKKKVKYWEWVFPRNFKLFSKNVSRIFVPGKERISNKDYFRFTIAGPGIFPTQDVTALFVKEGTKESIYYILALLNSRYVFDWLRLKGIIKGSIVEFSEKPIASIPFRKIDFGNSNEVAIHDKLSELTEGYIATMNPQFLLKINELINQLLSR